MNHTLSISIQVGFQRAALVSLTLYRSTGRPPCGRCGVRGDCWFAHTVMCNESSRREFLLAGCIVGCISNFPARQRIPTTALSDLPHLNNETRRDFCRWDDYCADFYAEHGLNEDGYVTVLAQAISRALHTNRDNAAVVAFLLTLLQVVAPT
jgi:hypothetical protein